MEHEITVDHNTGIFNRFMTFEHTLDAPEDKMDNCFRCVMLCRKIAPNVFDIKGGVAIIAEDKNFVTQDSRMVSCPARTTFVFE